MAAVPESDLPSPPIRKPVPASDLPDVSDIPKAETVAPKKKTLLERGKDVGIATGLGATAGAYAPNILTGLGSVAAAFPATAPAAPFLFGASQMARGARLASALSGGFGGLVGESAGQLAEAKGRPVYEQEAARVLGGMASPSAVSAATRPLVKAGGYGLSTLINKVVPGLGTGARTLGQILDDTAAKKAPLSERQQQFLEQKLASIRGGAPSVQPLKDVYSLLDRQAKQINQDADALATRFEQEAKQALETGQVRGDVLRTQYERSASKIMDLAKSEASTIVKRAAETANAIRQGAARQAPELRANAEQQAMAIIDAGRRQADDILAKSNERGARMRGIVDRLRSTSAGQEAASTQALGQIGAPATPTQTGEKARNLFQSEFDRLASIRKENADKYSKEAFGAAVAKEKAGQFVEDTPAFSKAMQNIDREIQNPDTKLQASIAPVREQLRKIVNELKPFKVVMNEAGEQVVVREKASFERLEQLRRFLRDRASGLPAEGYDAISQQQAGRIASLVEDIQREFSPGFGKFLEQYKADSKPLNDFKQRLGRSIIGKEDFDFDLYKTDPAGLGSKIFASAGSVQQFSKIVGPDQAEEIAKGYLADQLRNANSKKVRDVINSSRDWIGIFPNLAEQLNQTAQRMGLAERVVSRRGQLSNVLRTQISTLPVAAEKGMTRAEADAAKKAAAEIKAGEAAVTRAEKEAADKAAQIEASRAARAGEIVSGAEKTVSASEKPIERRVAQIQKGAEAKAGELTKQAAAARAEAKSRADLILSGKEPAERTRDLILNGSRDEWDAIAPIILESPNGKDLLAKAVGEAIARRAGQSLKGAIDRMQFLTETLVDRQLMSRSDANKISSKLQELFVTPVDDLTRMTLAQKLVRDLLTTYIVPRPISAIGGMVNAPEKRQ